MPRQTTVWTKEPYRSRMQEALKHIRLDGCSSAKVAKKCNIPVRTLRRYVYRSFLAQDPFYIPFNVSEEIQPTRRPQSTVPQFQIDVISFDQLCKQCADQFEDAHTIENVEEAFSW